MTNTSSALTNVNNEKDLDIPPAYTANPCLQPFAVGQNIRYDRKLTAEIIPMIVEPGLHSNLLLLRPQYLPSEWTEFFNPEGARYYVNSTINVVTDTAIHRPQLYEFLLNGVRELQAVASSLPNGLPQESEAFIQVQETECDNEKSCRRCNYYLVDHDTQTEFWLHPVDPYKLNIAQVTSASHIKYVLQEHYWSHVEYFPHRPISMKLRQELVSVLRHGQLDVMTSMSSTFPYTVAECEKYIKLLHESLNDTPDVYITCMTARLWHAIAHHRYDNFFGEDHARLERDHYVLGMPPVPRYFGMVAISTALFGLPSKINDDLEAIFVDNTVYGMRWQKFIRNMLESWKDSRLLAIFLVTVNAIFLTTRIRSLSTYIGLASMICATGSLSCSLALLQRYSGAEEQVASQAITEMCRLEHESLRFQPAAALFSIPKAFVNWSVILFTTEILSLLLEISTSWAAVIMAILLAVLLSATLVSLIVQWGLNAWRRYRSQRSVLAEHTEV